jgi:glycosyltransferase involved in cell wall biosynthesis
MREKPRLLIVGAFPPPEARIVGGVATSCRVLLASSLPQRAELVLVDTSQISNPPPGFFVRLLLAVRRGLQFVWKFETTKPDAVWLFASPGASAVEKGVLGWYARLRGRRTVLLPRGAPPATGGRLARGKFALCFGAAHRIVCQGGAWQKFGREALGRPADDLPIIRNWTATEEYLAIGRERIARGSGPVRLLYLGWVEAEKGILDLLEACGRLPDSVEYELDVVGDGRAMDAAREWIAARGHGRVRLHGWLHGGQKLERLRAADVFVLPSWSEGLPNAMIEAMASGLACVLTDVGNIRDAVGDDVRIVPARDTEALARCLHEVITDPALRLDLAQRGFARAVHEFATERAVGRLLDTLRDAAPA